MIAGINAPDTAAKITALVQGIRRCQSLLPDKLVQFPISQIRQFYL